MSATWSSPAARAPTWTTVDRAGAVRRRDRARGDRAAPGYLGPALRPIQDGARIAGTAVTVLCWPGDNLMIHAAVEQCRAGDILVVTTTSPSRRRLVRRAARDVPAAPRACAAWSPRAACATSPNCARWASPSGRAAVTAQGTVKATAGAVNVPGHASAASGSSSRRRDRRRRRRRGVRAADRRPAAALAAARREWREGERNPRRVPPWRARSRSLRPAARARRGSASSTSTTTPTRIAVTGCADGIRCMLMRGGTSKGAVLPRRGPARRPRGAGRSAAARSWAAGNPIQIDGARRRSSADLQGRGGLAVGQRRRRHRLPVPPGRGRARPRSRTGRTAGTSWPASARSPSSAAWSPPGTSRRPCASGW